MNIKLHCDGSRDIGTSAQLHRHWQGDNPRSRRASHILDRMKPVKLAASSLRFVTESLADDAASLIPNHNAGLNSPLRLRPHCIRGRARP